MKIQWKKLLIAIVIPLAVGALAGFLTMGGMEAFDAAAQPPLSPPDWVFPVVWTILYTLMGIASYLVSTSGADSRQISSALSAYGFQLALNFFWPFIFFNMRSYLLAAIWLIALLILVIVTAVRFYRIRPAAGWLLVPYIVWLLFAAYLNIGVYILNRPQ